MSYQYDVFVSYPRRGETCRWVGEHFIPALQHGLSLELDRDPKIFFDSDLDQGATWTVALGQSISRSRVLVSLWTKNYLSSEWCTLEISHMLARERDTHRRTQQFPVGLISIPIIHDGETIPEELRTIQYFELHGYFNPRMRKDSAKSEALYDIISQHAPAIARQIEQAPEWRSDWMDAAVEDFVQLFHRTQRPQQTEAPRYTS